MSQELTDEDVARLRKKPGRMHRSAAGAALNGGGWKQRRIERVECPSGEVVQIRRPGPEFTLRAGKVVQTFSKMVNQEPLTLNTELSPHLQGLEFISRMSDDELAAMVVFARELVCAMLVSPRLVQNPRPGTDQVGPDDIGDDFWFLFNYAMTGFFNLPVPVGGNQEVKISDLESFREESGVSADGIDGAEVRPDPEQPAGDPGLVGSS